MDSYVPDIGFTPEYHDLWTDTEFGGEPCHYENNGIDYRYYRRRIPGTDYYDAISPYGYGGPIGGIPALTGVVSEFVRCHPWECSIPDYLCVKTGEVAYIDLTQTEDEIWHGFDKGCRSSVRQAEKRERTWSMSGNVPVFFTVYYCRTMDRLNASPAYYFTPRFWEKLSACKPVTIGTRDAHALFFFHGNYATYFLSASDRKQQGSMNLILWTAIKEAKMLGCRIFNLGGGLHEGDSLSSFKRSFTPNVKPFYSYRKIHNPDIYAKLCKEKGIDPDSPGFFPGYRR
jgi:hypothetical protein